MRPEDALAVAREAAAAARAGGRYVTPAEDADERPVRERLLEWTVPEVDLRQVRSTRRAGAPITALKHGLLRLLGQYHTLLIAEQARFNVGVLRYAQALEDRVVELERRLAELEAER